MDQSCPADINLAEGGRGLQAFDAVAIQGGSFRLPQAQPVWCDFSQPLRGPVGDAWAWLRYVLSGCPLGNDPPRSPAAQSAPAGVR